MTSLLDTIELPKNGMPSGPPWLLDAGCAGENTELFYPHDAAKFDIAHAKTICGACPVRTACLDDALARNEAWGIWGGLTTPERRRLKAKRNKENAA